MSEIGGDRAPLIAALECLMYESWDGIPPGASKTEVRLHYIRAILRHFDVTHREGTGYSPASHPFIDYGNRK